MLVERISGERLRTKSLWEIYIECNGIKSGFYTNLVFLPDKKEFYTRFSAENAEFNFDLSERGSYCIIIKKADNIEIKKEWEYNPDYPENLAKTVTVE